MEQATNTALATLYNQLGIFGVILVFLIGLGVWWLKASKALRDEKESTLTRLQAENEKLREDRDKYQQQYLDYRYPDRESLEDL